MINLDYLNALLSEDLSPFICNEGAPDETWQSFAASAMLRKCLTKVPSEVDSDADYNATLKFLQADDRCKAWDHEIRFVESGLSEKPYGEYLLGTFANKLRSFFEPNGESLIRSFGHVWDHSRHGPGTSNGVTGTDLYTKMCDSTLTTTSPTLYRSYSAWCAEDPQRNALEWDRAKTWGTYTKVEGSKMFYVYKEREISRTATKGPSLNVYGQLGIGEIMCERLKQVYSIDLSDQPMLNRDMAYMGSLFDGFATIDLRSASDSVARRMLGKYLPASAFWWFETFGESVVEMRSFGPNKQEYVPYELGMMSTMGNGFTFPLETTIFACVVASVYDLFGTPLIRNQRGKTIPGGLRPGNFGVFGDDIIVLREVAHYVIELLDYLGFMVNETKSFVRGPFRESCGCDYHNGRPVRPAFVGGVDGPHEVSMAINSLNQWTARTGLKLTKTVGYMYSYVMALQKPRLVPVHEADDAGIRVPYDLADPLIGIPPDGSPNRCRKALEKARPKKLARSLRRDWTRTRLEPWLEVPSTMKLFKYQKWVAKPVSVHTGAWYVEDKDRKVKGLCALRPCNPTGLLSVLISGHLRQGKMSIRGDATIYRTENGYSPSWDAEPPLDTLPIQLDQMSFSDACRANFQFA